MSGQVWVEPDDESRLYSGEPLAEAARRETRALMNINLMDSPRIVTIAGAVHQISGGSPIHDLKTWAAEFQAIADGSKTFDLRRNDRDFQLGDTLLLREYDPTNQEYTGRAMFARVTYVLYGGSFGLHKSLCIMAIEVD